MPDSDGPPVPDLPESKEKLEELLQKSFEIIHEDPPISKIGGEWRPGMIACSRVKMRCPFCENEFSGTRKQGCFGGYITPSSCPNCGFPDNVMYAYLDLPTIESENN